MFILNTKHQHNSRQTMEVPWITIELSCLVKKVTCKFAEVLGQWLKCQQVKQITLEKQIKSNTHLLGDLNFLLHLIPKTAMYYISRLGGNSRNAIQARERDKNSPTRKEIHDLPQGLNEPTRHAYILTVEGAIKALTLFYLSHLLKQIAKFEA